MSTSHKSCSRVTLVILISDASCKQFLKSKIIQLKLIPETSQLLNSGILAMKEFRAIKITKGVSETKRLD